MRLPQIPSRLPACIALIVLTAACAFEPERAANLVDPRASPEAASGLSDPARPAARARHYMVAAAHPLAVEAGLAALEAGGGAIDAAVAAQMVLGLVEPQSSGIGGGAFLLLHDAQSREIVAYDGRETAPAQATPDMFLGPDGRPLAFRDAVVGGLSVGVPGVLRMLEAAHREHGRLPWERLFQPAIRLAEEGFPVPPRLAALLEQDKDLRTMPAAAYFYHPDGTPPTAGERLRNPAYADTLRQIAQRGADVFYTGPIAQDIVATVRNAPRRPGRMSEADLAAYRPVEREPVCVAYRVWRICSMPPPSSGGLAIAQILGLLERFPMPSLRPGADGTPDPQAVHVFAEAGKLAFADRNFYVADPDFVLVPTEALVDPTYLARRSALIRLDGAMPKAEPGTPPARTTARLVASVGHEGPSTSHLSIVDVDGNAVAMTTTIEAAFGSQLMTRGFLLNNQLTDFDFQPTADGRPVANRPEPGKRPRSSMAPTIVTDRDGRFVMAIGSPGGARIIGYVAEALAAALDWNLDAQAATALPHFQNRNGATEVEQGTAAERLIPELTRLGHEVKAVEMTSGLHAVRLRAGRMLEGGADPRRDGIAAGR